MSGDTPDGLTEQETEWFREECAVCLGDGCRKCEAVRDEVERIVAAQLAAARERADAAEAHVVHVTAEPVAEDVVWCESCEEWVTSGAPERAALGGEATP